MKRKCILGDREYLVSQVSDAKMNREHKMSRACCDPPHTRKMQAEIWIRDSITGKELLEILIHESRHAVDWNRDEYAVERESLQIADLVWKFRKLIFIAASRTQRS